MDRTEYLNHLAGDMDLTQEEIEAVLEIERSTVAYNEGMLNVSSNDPKYWTGEYADEVFRLEAAYKKLMEDASPKVLEAYRKMLEHFKTDLENRLGL